MSIESNKEEERLIAKIRKLFALAHDKNAQGNEAENALRMANALLSKHAIDKYRLHEEDAVFASFMDYDIKHHWKKSIIGTIARFYNCRAIFDYNWDTPKTLIIGTSSNRITAILVIDHLIDQVIKETRGEKIAFKNGAALGLYDTCNKIIEKRNIETGNDEVIPGTGLTVIKIEKRQKMDVEDFIKANFKHLRSGPGMRSVSAEGRSYGQGLNPNARITGEGQKRLS
jgi:hypothetical protein